MGDPTQEMAPQSDSRLQITTTIFEEARKTLDRSLETTTTLELVPVGETQADPTQEMAPRSDSQLQTPTTTILEEATRTGV